MHSTHIEPQTRFATRVDVAGTGFTVLDRIYANGHLSHESLGGSCGNVLVSLAMLKRQVAPVLVLGDDDEGRRLVCEFTDAGAVTNYIHCRRDMRSPVLAQELDTASGIHDFNFTCPETSSALPRYQPIGREELSEALPVLRRCSIFYADRLSESILEAMETAWSSGAIIFFEPSDVQDDRMFEDAMKMVSILKYSAERLSERLPSAASSCVRVITHGAKGLAVYDKEGQHWCNAIKASVVLDTCGSGDMVSVGIIDWMITRGLVRHNVGATALLSGVVAGQRLAAENCAYAGARGIFRKHGPSYVRNILQRNMSA